MRRLAWVAACLVWAAVCPAANLVPNPSAEVGEQAPASWQCEPASSGGWPAEGARFGGRCLEVKAGRGEAAWTTPALPAEAAQGYRLSGWVWAEGGRGWLEARFLGTKGQVALVRTPAVTERAWRYLAVEIPASRQAEQVRVRAVGSGGTARFDGIRLTPLDRNLLRNPELAPQVVEEKPQPFPAGWHALPQTERRPVGLAETEAGRRLRLGGECARQAASYLVDLPAGTRECVVRGQVSSPGRVRAALSWFGARGFIREDGSSYQGEAQVRLRAAPPAGANRVRVTLALEGCERGLAAVRQLVAVTGPTPAKVAAYANQVGYELEAGKTAVVASTAFPARPGEARWALVDEAERVVRSGRLVALGRVHEGRPDDWGAYYWLADLGELRAPGRYRLRAVVGGRAANSHPFQVDRGVVFAGTAELVYRHFYYQRCGEAVPGWHGACHLDDARLPDGSHLDLVGGWHDAGDYNKWMHPVGPALALYGMASAYRAHRGYFDRLDRDGNGRGDLLDEIVRGADWLMRMRNPKTGGLYGSITTGWSNWGLPEQETDNIPGNADDRPVLEEDQSVARAAAALALVARCLPEGKAYLEAAMQLEAYSRKEGRSPDRLLACLAIWQAAGSREHLEQAREVADEIAAGGGGQGVALAALALYAADAPGAADNPRYRQAMEGALGALAASQRQPFALAAGREGDRDLEDGNRLGQWGNNMTLTSTVWAAFACARALGSAEASRMGFRELDWLLGLNPLDLCMLEGAGSFNPPRYHHRYVDAPGHRDGAVPGAIPNGIGRPVRQGELDLPFFDWVNRDPMTAEPWIPYNGFLLCALAQMEPPPGR